MSDFKNNELRRLDLTVLLVFLGLLRHRKASQIAAELAITQSAVSHALKRLRDVFGDELFLRRPHGMEPTAVALALEAPIAVAVESLRRAVAGQESFDPRSAEGVVRLTAFDAELVTLVPELIRTFSTRAPGLRIIARAIGRQDALDAIAAGELDLALGYFWDLSDAFIREDLFEEDFLVVGTKKHRLAGKLSLGDYLDHPHILVSPGGDLRGIVDEMLESKGLKRQVIAALPLFLPALAAVHATNALATVPRRIASSYARAFQLTTAEAPLAIRSFSVAAIRHRRDENNPMHRWLLSELHRISAA
jgi:DNA-binding transcriptional LysR family regulator